MEYKGEERREQWYSNKDLFEMFSSLKTELVRTTEAVKKYNGVREQLDDVCKKVDSIISEGEGKNRIANGAALIIGIIGTLIGIAGAVLAIASKF